MDWWVLLKRLSYCLQMMWLCSSQILSLWQLAQYRLFLTSVHLLLPLFRDLLTTAHTQVCTVIRFSQSRFVPASRLLVVLDLPLSLSETLWLTDLDAANLCSFPLFLSVFVDSLGLYFYSSLFSTWNCPRSLFIFTLFCHFSASVPLHLRWSSPDTTMAFSLESSPTPFRDAF